MTEKEKWAASKCHCGLAKGEHSNIELSECNASGKSHDIEHLEVAERFVEGNPTRAIAHALIDIGFGIRNLNVQFDTFLKIKMAESQIMSDPSAIAELMKAGMDHATNAMASKVKKEVIVQTVVENGDALCICSCKKELHVQGDGMCLNCGCDSFEVAK